MTNAVKHLFICLLPSCMSSLEKCLLYSFPILKLGYLSFLLLSFKSALYILDTSFSSGI